MKIKRSLKSVLFIASIPLMLCASQGPSVSMLKEALCKAVDESNNEWINYLKLYSGNEKLFDNAQQNVLNYIDENPNDLGHLDSDKFIPDSVFSDYFVRSEQILNDLFAAIKGVDYNKMSLAFYLGVSAIATDDDGYTPLHPVVKHAKPETRLKKNNVRTPLDTTIASKNVNMIKQRKLLKTRHLSNDETSNVSLSSTSSKQSTSRSVKKKVQKTLRKSRRLKGGLYRTQKKKSANKESVMQANHS